MRVDDAVNHMTKWYLERVVDSFAKDFPKLDEDRAREAILRNVEELTDASRISGQLSFEGEKYSGRILQTYILEYLLACPDHAADEAAVIEGVAQAERDVLAASADPDSLRYEDENSLHVLEAVLEVALEDDHLSPDEFRLIQRLRHKLRVGETSKRILLARLGHFPQPGNDVHGPSEVRDALAALQRRGVVFYANRLNGGRYLIPDEVVAGVKQALGIELTEKPWRLLLASLTKKHLAAVLESAGIPKAGSKEEQIERVIAVGIDPSEALDTLSSKELYELCGSLPGVNVGGTKPERIERIVEYFDNLVVKDIPEEASPRERYYEYLVQLAHRDRENLLTNKIIKKDLHMESEGSGTCSRRSSGSSSCTCPVATTATASWSFPTATSSCGTPRARRTSTPCRPAT